MFHIDASQLDHRRLNEQIRHSPGTLRITGWKSRGRREMRWAPIWTAPASRCAAMPRTPSAIR